MNGQWTVWNGNRNTNTVKLDQIAEQEAELSTKETANSIQERIAQIFTQILYLDENVKVGEQTLETSKKNEERGQEMVNVGKMSKADLVGVKICFETRWREIESGEEHEIKNGVLLFSKDAVVGNAVEIDPWQ